MIDTLSEDYIRKNCPFDDENNVAFTYLLEETEDFRVVCDYNPLTEGHILIVTKQHVSCIGEYSEDLFYKFMFLYDKVSRFILKNYGKVSSFEHGKTGQTVFHSHVHLLPFSGSPVDIIPEGEDHLEQINDIVDLKGKNEYLFFSIGDNRWTVDTAIGAPRFFRDRFAKALGSPERGNWKIAQTDPVLREKFDRECLNCVNIWREQFTNK